MKKLLILAYDFPPYVSVGGLRPYSWYKYLKDFNVYPIVVTRQWSNAHGSKIDYISPGTSNKNEVEHTQYGTIIKVPYIPTLANKIMLKFGEHNLVAIRKTITGIYEILQWFFLIGSKKTIYRGADEYLKNNKVDAIIATGDPFILFRYASMLSKKYNIPFIADYRDPWTQNYERNRSYLKKFNAYLEKKYSAKANLITTVSDFFKNKIEEISTNRNIKIIRNGYDENNLLNINIQSTHKTLQIGFAGTIYPWHPINQFLEIIHQFNLDHKSNPVKINLLGININVLSKIENEYPGLSSHIRIYPKMDNKNLMNILAEQHTFFLFNDYSIIGTKIYDYLALKRKILFCFSNEPSAIALKEKHYRVNEFSNSYRPQEKVIKETRAGIIIEDKNHLYDVLTELNKEFQQTGNIACETNGYEQYSRKYQAGKLAEIINQLTIP
jgi:hypothetical protein